MCGTIKHMRNKETYNTYQRKYQLDRYHRRRQGAILALGGKCRVCGSTENLELDHIDWRDKSFPISGLWSVSETRYLAELAKCQVLCHKHHLAKTRAESPVRRPLTHGKAWAAYKHKCDCEECKLFRQENAAKRRKS